MAERRVVMGLLFYPRGGSAYVVRYLSPALARAGWTVGLAVGSLGVAGEETHAPTFFAGLDVHVVDSTDAVRTFEAGGDAIAAPQPMHPSYEDRAGVPDVVLRRGPTGARPTTSPRCGRSRCAPPEPTERTCCTSTTSHPSSTQRSAGGRTPRGSCTCTGPS